MLVDIIPGSKENTVIFINNGCKSKDIPLKYDSSFSWKPLKRTLNTCYTRDELIKKLKEFNCFLVKISKFYIDLYPAAVTPKNDF